MNWHTVLLSILMMVGCKGPEVATTVTVSKGTVFSFTGSGRLASFTVSAPLDGQKIAVSCGTRLITCGGQALGIWQIEASGGYFEGHAVDGMKIPYGRVPPSYKQLIPSNSQTPPALRSDVIYSFFAESTEAGATGGAFHVDKSGSVQLIETDLCTTIRNGREFRISCKTGQPYVEPFNIDKFVADHPKVN